MRHFTRHKLTPFAAVLAIFATALGGQAQVRSLTLDEAVDLAQRNNPDYRSTQNQVGVAEWQVRSAYGNLLPSISAANSFGYTARGERRFDSVVLDQQPAIYSSRYNLGMSLSLDGSTLLAPSVARAQERATRQQVEGAAATLEANVAQSYLTVLEAREAMDQAEREVARTLEHLRLAEARLEVGTGTQLEVRRAEVQHGQAEVQLLQAENAAANEVLLLSQTLGVRLAQDVALTDEFDLFQPTWTAEQLIATAMAENPDLRASRAQADAAQTRARAARTAYLPSLSFSAGLSGYISQASNVDPLISRELQRASSVYSSCLQQNELRDAVGISPIGCINPTAPLIESEIRERVIAENRGFPFDYMSQPASASVTISLPLFTGLDRQLQVEEARIARLNADHQVRATELRLETEIETALRNLQTSYRSALLQQQIRQTAEQELALAEERFRLGLATSVEIVDAQASLADAERAEIAAVYSFHRSLALLEARLGEPLVP